MKRVIFITGLFIALAFSSVHAQSNRALRKADKKFSLYSYADASAIYEALYEESPNDSLALKIATCKFKMNQLTEAKKWYDNVQDKSHMSPEHHLHYGDVLESVGEYEEASKWYGVYKEEQPSESRATEKLYGATHIAEFYKDSSRYKIEHLSVNTKYSDFSPAYFEDGIVFVSARLHEVGSSHTFKWDNSSFLNLYYSKYDSTNNDYSVPDYFDARLNSKFHEGPLAFDGQSDKLIFTRNNYFKAKRRRSDDKVMKLKMYYTERDSSINGQHGWGHLHEFPFNSDEYSVGHPTVTKDYSILIFASDKEGGIGGTDLYYSRNENGNWTEPVNMGKDINTEGDDMFPFLHEDGTLYYASNGRGGLGGLDIYKATPSTTGQAIDPTKGYSVEDIGYPVNSSKDDFGLILNDTKTKGYFTSNRPGGTGSDDIYSVIITEVPKVPFEGIVYVKTEGDPDSERKLLPNALVKLVDESTKEEIGTTTTDAEGKFSYELERGKVYSFTGTKDTLIQDVLSVDLSNKSDSEPENIELTLIEPLPNVIRMCIEVQDKDNNNQGLAGAKVYIMEEGGTEVREYITDADGNVCTTFDPNKNYVVKSTKVKYLADCFTINSGDLSKQAKAPEKPLVLEQLKISQKFRYDKILFDLNKHFIRKDAAIELDKVVEFIKANPGITVELGAHTDSRGSDKYNEALSDRRAKSSREYIVSQGVDPSIITAKGYGEYQLTNKCADGVRCNEDLHQANRRTEIKITGIKDMTPEEEAKLQTSIKGLEPNVDYSDDCEEVEVILVK